MVIWCIKYIVPPEYVSKCTLLLATYLTDLRLQESRTLAEIAKAELDGTILKNRPIRIRFATHGSALTVRNLSPVVTNELLEEVRSRCCRLVPPPRGRHNLPGTDVTEPDLLPFSFPSRRPSPSSVRWSAPWWWWTTGAGPRGRASWSSPTSQRPAKRWNAAGRAPCCSPRKRRRRRRRWWWWWWWWRRRRWKPWDCNLTLASYPRILPKHLSVCGHLSVHIPCPKVSVRFRRNQMSGMLG